LKTASGSIGIYPKDVRGRRRENAPVFADEQGFVMVPRFVNLQGHAARVPRPCVKRMPLGRAECPRDNSGLKETESGSTVLRDAEARIVGEPRSQSMVQ
jgi:hypothetical protein